MQKTFMFALMVSVLLLIFTGMAMPEIQNSLLATQAAGSGISPPLNLAISSFPIILPLGFIVMAVAILTLGFAGRR